MPDNYAVILVPGTGHALRAEKVLQRAGIECKLIPIPRHISSDCGVCVRIERTAQEAALQALGTAGVQIEEVRRM